MNNLPSQINLIGNALRNAEQNHRVISQNVANVNTPGYQTRELDFDEFLEQVKSGNAEKGTIDSVSVQATPGLTDRVDGNNVDIDQQVGSLKKNALLFQTYSQLLAAKMSTLRTAITGR